MLSRFQTSSLPRPVLSTPFSGVAAPSWKQNFTLGFSNASSAWRVLTPQEFPLTPAPSERAPQSLDLSSELYEWIQLSLRGYSSRRIHPTSHVGDSKFEVCLLPLDGLPYSATAKN